MGLETRIVSDAAGKIDGTVNGQELRGTIQAKDNNPYVFYAVKSSDYTDKQDITIVLPVGGATAGLYRFPRVGEKVLVDKGDDNQYYLLGYLPGDTDNDAFIPRNLSGEADGAEKNKLFNDGQGMALRYKKTGIADVSGRQDRLYSEIGFYHDATGWGKNRVIPPEGFIIPPHNALVHTSRRVYEDSAAKQNETHDFCFYEENKTVGTHPFGTHEYDEAGLVSPEAYADFLRSFPPSQAETLEKMEKERVLRAYSYPMENWWERYAAIPPEDYARLMGWVNANYTRKGGGYYPKINAIKISSAGDIRSEAVNYHEINAKRLEILAGLDSYDHTQDGETSAMPLGDMPGDDPHLYAGDAHIRAKNRIVIKAEDEIVLQVGRSSIRITDGGITLASKKVKGNFVNHWNTLLSLTPRDGITMFGQQLNMKGAFKYSLSDAMGGELTSLGGVVRLQGKDIKASTLSTCRYLGKQLAMLSQFGICVDAMRSGMDSRLRGDVNTGTDNARLISGKALDMLMPMAVPFIYDRYFDVKTEIKDVISSFLLILDILISINSVCCGVLVEGMLKTKAELKNDARDKINLAQMVVEFRLVTDAAVALAAGFGIAWTRSAAFHLRGTAHIEQESLSYKTIGTQGECASAPLAGSINDFINGNEVIKEPEKSDMEPSNSSFIPNIAAALGLNGYSGTAENALVEAMGVLNAL